MLFESIGLIYLGLSSIQTADLAMELASKDYPNGIPAQFDAAFRASGATYGVDWKILKAIAMNESRLGLEKSVALGLREPNNVAGSKSYDGKSWGLMQVTIGTGRWLDAACTEAKLNDAEYSIELSARYIAHLKTLFNPKDARFLEWVIKSYNQGPGNTKNEIKNGNGTNYPQAREYWQRFERNYGRL